MQKQSKNHRALPILLAFLLVAVIAAATVYAYLQAKTPAVTNSVGAAGDHEVTITENFDQTTKSNVRVQVGNIGYSVYVRAAIVVTWKDASGNVSAVKPVAGTDYTISLNDIDWFETDDGFYYYRLSVKSGGSTSNLINTCTPVEGKNPAGYELNVEIISQTIQALGSSDSGVPAVKQAWGIDVDVDGYLVKP
jgi:hypothetical protein